jgi:hypothetical protein
MIKVYMYLDTKCFITAESKTTEFMDLSCLCKSEENI